MKLFIALGLLVATCAMAVDTHEEPEMKTLYEISVERITGETIKLIVNTASKCGFTGQYAGLQKLHEAYAERGLVVLGFPCNDFARQEPGSNDAIYAFCQLNYGVDFPMFAKLHVKGDNQHPLYSFLTSKRSNPDHASPITWNFNKFLIGRDGTPKGHYGSRVKPSDSKLLAAIEAELGNSE